MMPSNMWDDADMRDGLSRAIWSAGIVASTLIAAVAALTLATQLGDLWRHFPDGLRLAGVGVSVIVIGLAVGALRLYRLGRWPEVPRWLAMPWSGLALLVLLRVIAVVFVDAPLQSDPKFLHELAVGVLHGGNPIVAHRPMGYSTLLAGVYALFGPDPHLAELLNLALAAITGILLFGMTRDAFGRSAAGVALVLYAIAPAQILLVLPVLTEVLYGMLLVAAAWAAIRVGRHGVLAALASGALLGVSQYVRPLSQALLGGLVLLPFLLRVSLPRAAVLAAAIVIAFVVVLIPIIAWNFSTFGELSASSSSYAGWSLFVGTDQKHDGMFNQEDANILAAQPGSSWWVRSEALGKVGVQRILSDPVGFAELAVRKFSIMWSNENYGVVWSMRDHKVNARVPPTMLLLSQAFYAFLTALVGWVLYRERHRRPPLALVIVSLLLIVVVGHTFVEVQSRYHAYMIPLFCALGGLGLASVARHRDEAARPPRPAKREGSGR